MPRKPSAGEGFFNGFIIDSKPLMERMEWDMYEKVDQLLINRQLSLKAGLNRYPAGWLNATCAFYYIPVSGLKRVKVENVVENMMATDEIAGIVESLSDVHRKALATVVNADGWVKYSVVSKQVGDETPDSYFWESSPPASVIGQLRLRGLIFVGRVVEGNRRYKAIVVPKELRASLALVLPGPNTFGAVKKVQRASDDVAPGAGGKF
jgi:hypothetical protein